MAHPRMYRDDDPYLTDLRAVRLGLPETSEVEAWGRPTFRAGKKMFAVFTGSEEDRYSVIFKPEVGELMEVSYRHVALKRMLKALDERA